jgi:hypothetical protein
MPVVGTLTVDLVANTAQFSGDMGKASQAAEDFGKSASAAGEKVDFSMREAKGSMMLLGEEVGVHIPRHLQALIAQIPGVGLAFAEMLPIVGVIAAIAIIAKLIAKTDEAKEKMAQGWDNFGVTSLQVFNNLDDKMLKVGITADELAGKHLAALHKELLLIDHASLHELAEEFGKLEKAGHTLMVEMKSSWYEIRSGSQGAENALSRFTGEYDLLLAKGDTKGAFDKLVGTLDSANKELKKMEQAQQAMGMHDGKAIEAQRLLVSLLEDQLKVTDKVAAITTGEKGNANTEEAHAEATRQSEIFNSQQKGLNERLVAERKYREEKIKLAKTAQKEEESLTKAQFEATEAVQKEGEKTQTALDSEAMKQALAMAKLSLAGKEEAARHELAMHRATAQEAADIEVAAAQQRLKIELDALDAEGSLLNTSKDAVKLQEIEDKKTQIILQAANEQTKIRDAAAAKQYADISRAENQMTDAVVKTAAKSIMEGKNMAQAFAQQGQQMAESALENTLKMILTGDMQKLADAKVAAANAYASASAVPLIGPALAPVAAATAFASVMAFEKGGEIPGSGAVPIIGHGGETVVTKALTDQVKGNTGRAGGNQHFHFAPVINAIDGDGVESMLKEHSSKFAEHVTSEIRRLNQ